MDEDNPVGEEIDGIDDVRALDQELIDYDEAIVTALAALHNGLLDALRDLLDRLSLNGRATTSEEVRRNLRIVTIWRSDLDGLLDRLGLSTLLDAISAKITDAAGRINRYFGVATPGVAAPVSIGGVDYADLVGQLTDQTRTLLTETVVGTYGPLLDKTLNYGVLSRSTTAELRSALVGQLAVSTPDVTPTAVKQLGQVASDALYTFSRGYAQAVAEGLQLRHYYYMGTEIVTTRDFCHERIGKAYTQLEVESWANLVWSGKIPGTTSLTIFWYAGGYRCRHRILPITKRVYLYLTNNNS